MDYHGDIALESTQDFKFTTDVNGTPTALVGGTVVAYPANSTTEITAGLTLTADLDSRTGLNNVRVVATTANGYLTATNYSLVLSAGTVGGVSVVGRGVGAFSIESRVSGSGASAASIADAVWDEVTTSHTTSGTFGEQTKTDIDALLALLDDARGEPAQGAPPVNPDLATKIDYLYKFTYRHCGPPP